MRYITDNDLHIHSYITPCAGYDQRQTKEAILAYGVSNDIKLLCVADHIWDRKVETPSSWNWLKLGLDLERGRDILPLPQSPECRFIMGMEVDIDYAGNIGVSREEIDNFDFLVFSPSHQHLENFTIDTSKVGPTAEERKHYYLQRMNHLLDQDLPFHKTGMAHPVCSLICKDDPFRVLDIITDREYEQVWGRVAKCGMGVELNMWTEINTYGPKELECILRPLRIAKAMGCKFYMGSDSHTTEGFKGMKKSFEKIVDLLDLTEDDKLPIIKELRATGKKD